MIGVLNHPEVVYTLDCFNHNHQGQVGVATIKVRVREGKKEIHKNILEYFQISLVLKCSSLCLSILRHCSHKVVQIIVLRNTKGELSEEGVKFYIGIHFEKKISRKFCQTPFGQKKTKTCVEPSSGSVYLSLVESLLRAQSWPFLEGNKIILRRNK